MKGIKTYLILLVFWAVSVQFASAESTMDQQNAIVSRLKAQGIEPDKIYFQNNFQNVIEKDKSFPSKKLFSSLNNSLETNPSMDSRQNIAQIQLNHHYQYRDILERDRGIVEILYPTEPFATLDDGIHFYVFDEQNQLQKKESFADVYKLPVYIRVEKQNGKVSSIQKRPILSINHYTYNYWPNQNIKSIYVEKYNNESEIIYTAERFFDENGKEAKATQNNFLTQQMMRYTYNYNSKEGIEIIAEYFDSNGQKTNNVIYYNFHTPKFSIKNQRLNGQGEVIEVSPNIPNNLFEFPPNLTEPYPYNTLIRDLEKTSLIVSPIDLFNNNSLQLDNEAINRAKYQGITPNKTYYHQDPYRKFNEKRYKNFPHHRPLTLIEAENQQPEEKYSDLIQFEVGDNYQYKTLIKQKWQQTPINLPVEQFSALENGVYFFVMDENNKRLTPLDNVEQAIKQPSYVRVEKEMGKIISMIHKIQIYKVLNTFEYQDNDLTSSHVSLLESTFFPYITVESQYKNYFPTNQTIKNDKGITLRKVNCDINLNDFHLIIEKFNDDGVKINHIESSSSYKNGKETTKNEYLDAQGQIIKTTNTLDDITESQFYDELPFFIDDFEQILFNHYLIQYDPYYEDV
jgi:hypothetical protein